MLNWLIPLLFVLITWTAAVYGMRRNWKKRSITQRETLGEIATTDSVSQETPPILPPLEGLYPGSVLSSDPYQRIVIDDVGYRTSAQLLGYEDGILLRRDAARDIWIRREKIIDVRVGPFLAGKLPPGGVLIIEHQLDGPGIIQTGFRVDPTSDFQGYKQWVTHYRPQRFPSEKEEVT